VVLGGEDVPSAAGHPGKEFLDSGEEARIVIHEQERFSLGDIVGHRMWLLRPLPGLGRGDRL
jgi:hypothetical protein